MVILSSVMLQWIISATCKFSDLSRRAVVSREAKKKQHAHASSGQCDHYSELFARMDGLNFLNAVAQPLLQLLLSFLQTQHFLLRRTNN